MTYFFGFVKCFLWFCSVFSCVIYGNTRFMLKLKLFCWFRAEYEAFPELSGGNSRRIPYIAGILCWNFRKHLTNPGSGCIITLYGVISVQQINKCVDGCGFPPHAESAFTESCRLVQGSKASACDPPVADSPNPRCTYGSPLVIQEYGYPGDTGDIKTVRISTVKGKCIDGCTEADLAYIYALLSLWQGGFFNSCSSAPD